MTRFAVPVTKPHLPRRAKLDHYLDTIYESGWLTNDGPLVKELTRRLRSHLGVDHLLLVANGTLALQVAYRALGVTAGPEAARPEAVTTPFSFVATSSSLAWEGVSPVFADIDAESWCLDAARVEAAITERTKAIVAVHVFGNPCDVGRLDGIAKRHGLKVIYDGAHAFGVSLDGMSLLRHGDATTLSFHATKPFHTIEGGAIVFERREHLERAKRLINFGIVGHEKVDGIGINAKMNEFQAAMGLCVLDEMDTVLEGRERVWKSYQSGLAERVQLQRRPAGSTDNYGYFPLLLASEAHARDTLAELWSEGLMARRYFAPSLDTLSYLDHSGPMEISRDVASRVLCLPVYGDVPADAVDACIEIVARNA